MIRRSLHNGCQIFQTDEVRSQEESFMENGEDAGVGEKAMKFRNRDIRQDENPGITIPKKQR